MAKTNAEKQKVYREGQKARFGKEVLKKGEGKSKKGPSANSFVNSKGAYSKKEIAK